MNLVAEQPAAVGLDHLSWSKLTTYKQCPRRFRLRYLDNLPEERTASALLYGGAVHKAVESVHEARLAGEKIPSAEVLVKHYEAAWKEAAAQKPEISYARDEDAGALKDLALRTLTAYRQHVTESRGGKAEVIAIEHPARFQLLPGSDTPEMEARLDLIEKSKDAIIVTDFKTSRSSWNDSKVAENFGQVVLYGHAVMPMVRAFNAKRVITRFIVLTKGKAPKVQVLEPRPEQADVIRLKETVSDVWAAVQAEVFPRNESWHCPACPFKDACLGGKDCGREQCQN